MGIAAISESGAFCSCAVNCQVTGAARALSLVSVMPVVNFSSFMSGFAVKTRFTGMNTTLFL
jgi:hypothetical protein